MQQAVGPLAVRERRLEGVGALGQAVLDDGLHAHLAEGAARLLVGEDLLKRDHVGGKLGQVLLRRVDHGEPLVELGDGIRWSCAPSRLRSEPTRWVMRSSRSLTARARSP